MVHNDSPAPPPVADPNLGSSARVSGLDAKDAHQYLWSGRIVSIDYETMVCTVRYDTGTGQRDDVPIPSSGGSGPRSWAGIIPEVGSKVILGWSKVGSRGYEPHIIQFMTPGVFSSREFELFSSIDPDLREAALAQDPTLEDDPDFGMNPVRLKLRKAYPGDFLASASGGADLLLDRDVLLTNRAGTEIRLRDADQTAILQTLNYFENSAAGYIKRGLITRNAFNLLPDLGFDDTFGIFARETNPTAFDLLVSYGILKPDGTKNFPPELDDLYPYMVTPDGIRQSFIHHGETDKNWISVQDCYIEDRIELRHTSNGVMDVTDVGDGFQMDRFDPFITDVKGTVVGNNPYSEEGRSLYKQILTMSLFDHQENVWNSGIKPKFTSVDTLTRGTNDADTLALARLFTIKCPSNSNSFTFGITKEGRTFLYVPASTGNDRGKSIDVYTSGKVRCAFGADPNDGVSLDMSCSGGMKLDLGRDIKGNSIDVRFNGMVSTTYVGNDSNGLARKTTVGGSDYEAISASKFKSVNGTDAEIIGGNKIIEAQAISFNAGFGGIKLKSSGDVDDTILGKRVYKIAQLQQENYALGRTSFTLLGAQSSTVLAGSDTRTVVAGNISDSVGTGNMSLFVGAGNLSLGVGAGNASFTTGAGAITMATALGAATVASTALTTITSAAIAQIIAPLMRLGAIPTSAAVLGIPGPPGVPMLDYITGLPLIGSANIQTGI